MSAYLLVADKGAQRELDRLPPRVADGLRLVLRALAAEPRSKRFDLKALKAIGAHPPALRLGVGEYRVILFIDHANKEIRVVRFGHRKDVYRGLNAFD